MKRRKQVQYSEASREYTWINRERINERNKRYYHEHKEEIKAKRLERMKNDKTYARHIRAQVKEASKFYRYRHRELCNLRSKESRRRRKERDEQKRSKETLL
jgi:hypothetical protein